MKRLAIVPILFFLSCSPPNIKITDISARDGDTYFTINGSKAEFNGTFGKRMNPMVWIVNTRDIIRIEQIIQEAAAKKTTNQYDYENNTRAQIHLTDKEAGLLQDITTHFFYRVYSVGTNKQYDKIMEILFYPNQNSSTITADLIVNISNTSVEIR